MITATSAAIGSRGVSTDPSSSTSERASYGSRAEHDPKAQGQQPRDHDGDHHEGAQVHHESTAAAPNRLHGDLQVRPDGIECRSPLCHICDRAIPGLNDKGNRLKFGDRSRSVANRE